MTVTPPSRSLADRIAGVTTGRRSAWVVLVLAALLTGLVISLGSGVGESSDAPNSLPEDAESARVSELQQEFPGADVLPAIAVFAREGEPLTEDDLAAVGQAAQRFGEVVDAETSPPVPSPDGEAAIVSIPVSSDLSGFNLTEVVDELRGVAGDGLPDGLTVELTGGAAFAADTASAFEGADLRLLLVTALVVAVLLLLTYRSPTLWLVPLVVVALADRAAASLTALAADALGSQLDGSTTGITSVLVFGAGTNYALLLVSRYREELRRTADHRQALADALRAAIPAILASNLTVVLALLTLLLGVLPNNQSLGVSAAIGLVVALLFALFVLPAALSVFGRGLFWPFIPRVGDEDRSRSGGWFTVARAVTRRPAPVVAASIVVLAVLASGLLGAKLGLSQTEQFRVEAESVDGLETLSRHFPPGASDPVIIIAPADLADETVAAVRGTEGVVEAESAGRSGNGLVQITATLDSAPSTDGSIAAVEALRENLDEVSTDALVGGSVAQDLDSRNGTLRDIRVIIPMILGVVFLVLLFVLRAVATPLVLISVNILSSLAALGAGAWVSQHVFGFPALDVGTPLFSFLFLVALGIDYTIFLVLRAREETPEHGTREGMVQAVGLTGSVITSAGLVLAAVFAVLGVLPLITLTQIGIIVGLGILIDTFFVRTVLVPALFALIGPKVWWPSDLSRQESGRAGHRGRPDGGPGTTPPERGARADATPTVPRGR
jgi:putative drug exporter of the RND superfamily